MSFAAGAGAASRRPRREDDFMEPVLVEGFDVAIDAAEVRRLLGKKGAKRAPLPEGDPRVDKPLAEALEAARSLVEPRGVYVYAAGRDLAGSTVFARLERMAFCVCTIGSRLEDEVSRLTERDEILRAVILDAAGSVAAEAVADRIDRLIGAEASREGLKTSCRASPGYGDWDVREQRMIFDLVPAERIGVRLSPSFMMIPRKSISFAVHVAREPETLRSENSCENCGRKDCEYRPE